MYDPELWAVNHPVLLPDGSMTTVTTPMSLLLPLLLFLLLCDEEVVDLPENSPKWHRTTDSAKMSPAKRNPFTKNLNHFLSCDRCGFDNLPCPRNVQSKDPQVDKETQCSEENKTESTSINSDIFPEVSSMSMDKKCALLREILRSEKISIKEDKKLSELPENATIDLIATADFQQWYENRNPLMRAIGDEFAQVIFKML